MANLFFVHTPLQLLVAQQIIHQCNLSNNVMLYGYVGTNKHFLDIYDLTVIDEMWSKKISFNGIDTWAEFHQTKYFIKDAYNTYIHYQRLCAIVNDNNIDAIYLSDMNNSSYKFASVLFNKKGNKICFFEDGTSHYSFTRNPYANKQIKNKVISIFMDLCYFIPFYGAKWGWRLKCEDMPFSELPIDIRYSLRPFYKEKFDKLIHYTPLISDRLEHYIKAEIDGVNFEKSVLFMSSPIYELINSDEKEYLEIIGQYMGSFNSGNTLFVKFHPREKELIKEKIIAMLKEYDIPFKILSREINIPVEYYLQYIKFKEIVSFYTSTSFYNGYLFPHMKFVYLVEPYYKLCKERDKKYVSRLDEIMDMISKIEKTN